MTISGIYQSSCNFLTTQGRRIGYIEETPEKIERASKKIQELGDIISSNLETTETIREAFSKKTITPANISKNIRVAHQAAKDALSAAEDAIEHGKDLLEITSTSNTIKFQIYALKRLSGKVTAEAALVLQEVCLINCLQKEVESTTLLSMKAKTLRVLTSISLINLLQSLLDLPESRFKIKTIGLIAIKSMDKEKTPIVDTNTLRKAARICIENVFHKQETDEIALAKNAITDFIESELKEIDPEKSTIPIPSNIFYSLSITLLNDSKIEYDQNRDSTPSCIDRFLGKNSRSTQIIPNG